MGTSVDPKLLALEFVNILIIKGAGLPPKKKFRDPPLARAKTCLFDRIASPQLRNVKDVTET